MEAGTVLQYALYAALIVLAGVAVWALTVLVKTARSTQRLVDDMDARLVPLIENADRTLDALNAELERVDGIVTQIEEMSEQVSSTTKTASDLVNAPMAAVAGLSDRARRFASILFGRRL